MLSPSERELIFQTGVSINHDYWLMSLAYGEPFLKDGLIVYFDGRLATICGFPLRGASGAKRSLVRSLALNWVVERGAQAILFLGPEPVNLGFLSEMGFRRVALQKRRRVSAELELMSARDHCSAETERVYQRIRRCSLVANVRQGGVVTADHLRLIECFFSHQERSAYLADLAFSLPAVLAARQVWLIEAWRDDQLLGFAAVHKPFVDALVGVFLAHDRRTPRVSDFLYAGMLDLARRLGTLRVNIGPSPTEGHYRFKLKWGGQACVAPYYLVEWARGVFSRRVYDTFWPRTIAL